MASPVEGWPVAEALADEREQIWAARLDTLKQALDQANADRTLAECACRIQTEAVQFALDLLVREPDITGFFRAFTKSLVEECGSHTCSVWLLDETGTRCDLWMAYVGDRFFTKESDDWDAFALKRETIAAHLVSFREGWTRTMEYEGDDPRLPDAVRGFNREKGVDSFIVAPLALPTRNLGWMALCTSTAPACESAWHRTVVEATVRQATLALHHHRMVEQGKLEIRRQAVLEERNRIARDIHDTLTQGFAAILMQLQAAQRAAPDLPASVKASVDTAIDLARTHIIEARRSVGALRPQTAGEEDVATALHRITELARRTTDVPIELTVDALPLIGGGVDREIVGIAQEALTNAVRHARARRIAIRASAVRSLGFRLSVADDGRGIAKEQSGTGFGMTSMHERAERIGASLTIVTAPRAGTEVVLAWEPPSFLIAGSPATLPPEVRHAAD